MRIIVLPQIIFEIFEKYGHLNQTVLYLSKKMLQAKKVLSLAFPIPKS